MSSSTVFINGNTQVYPAGIQEELLIYNVGTSVVYLGSAPALIIGSNSIPLAPGSSILWNANVPLFATTVQGTTGTLQLSSDISSVFDTHAIANAIAASNYQFASQNSAAASGNVATTTFPAVPTGFLWLVGRITVVSNSTTPTSLGIYLDTVANGSLLDYTLSGNSDVADENTPIVITAGHKLVANWTNASNGSIGTCNLQYQLIQTLS